ncbi:MAG: PQQ-binding-like beta-propeller repeat protein [Actinomycetota bacterium]
MTVGPVLFSGLRSAESESPDAFEPLGKQLRGERAPVVIGDGPAVTVTVSPHDRAALLYREEAFYSPVQSLKTGDRSVTFIPCPTEGRATRFDGGFVVTGPGCVAIDVSVAGERPVREWVAFGTGQGCLGQREAPAPTKEASWTADLGAAERSWGGPATASAPVVAEDVVYVGAADGRLYAFPMLCGTEGEVCDPLWTGQTGDRIASTPAVGEETVFVQSMDGYLYAFPIGCDKAECEPFWKGHTGGYPYRSSPVVAGDKVFVEVSDGNRTTTLFVFPSRCQKECDPIWKFTQPGVFYGGPATDAHSVFAVLNDTLFKIECKSKCSAARMFRHPALTPPAVAGGRVFVASHERIYAFSQGCRGGCGPKWLSVPVQLNGDLGAPGPVVESGKVYMPTDAGSLAMIPGRCPGSPGPGSCRIRGLGEYAGLSFAPAAVGEGLAAVSLDLSGEEGAISVFDADCSGLCEPIWSSPVKGPSGVSAPAIAHGEVLVSSGGRLYAFAVS